MSSVTGNPVNRLRHHIRRNRRKFFSRKAWKVRLVFWAGAVLVGLSCALFAALADRADEAFHRLVALGWWVPLVLTPLVMTGLAWATRNIFPGSQGSGIPQTIAALQSRRKGVVLSLRIAIGKILLTLGGLMVGASIGREGPSVHVGASIMYSLGRYARFPAHYMERGLILAGGAAGIAAAFNTPLAGIVFAIEEMSKSFESRTSGLVTIAVVIAGVTALVVLGPYHYFGSSEAFMPDAVSWFAIPVCGVIGGLLGGLFATALLVGTRRLAPVVRRRPYRVAFICGLVVAAVGYLSDYSSSGTGYAAAKAIIQGEAAWDPMFPITKITSTIASYLSGIPGGIFAPSLATGAGVGANLGHWLPLAPLSVMVMLGMVGYFAGVVQSPLTAVIIVMEMTNNQAMLLPLIATAFIAYGVSHLVCPQPIYQALSLAFLGSEKAEDDTARARARGAG
ncbi:MAG: chloride channel protein [Chromatiales bacterium]|jgi:H+/Cl- antiporter ClcA|nr:chloride channel protein [Chromatiales bacterium]MDX9767610.1 chloride channel protein [Ectothiorhodospiraceae bacterium]